MILRYLMVWWLACITDCSSVHREYTRLTQSEDNITHRSPQPRHLAAYCESITYLKDSKFFSPRALSYSNKDKEFKLLTPFIVFCRNVPDLWGEDASRELKFTHPVSEKVLFSCTLLDTFDPTIPHDQLTILPLSK